MNYKTISKSLIGIIIAFIVLLPVSAKSFYSDVPDDHENRNAIEYFSIICRDEFSEAKFLPNETITRSKFLKIVFCDNDLEDTDVYANTEISFTDISGDEDYILELKLAMFWDAIKGFEDNTFKPEKKISVLEAIKILLTLQENFEKSFFGKYISDNNFNEKNPDWVSQYLIYSKKLNLLDNIDEKIYKNITKADIAEILYRFEIMDKTNSKSYTKNSEDSLDYITFLVNKEQKKHLKEIQIVSDMFNTHYLYPEEMNAFDPYREAIKGIISGLKDPYTAAYDYDIFSTTPTLFDQIDIGFTVDSKETKDRVYFYVDAIDKKSEAYKLGLRKNSIIDILNVFSVPTNTEDEEESHEDLLFIEYRNSIYSQKTKVITASTTIADKNNVQVELLENDILYLRVRVFDPNAAEQLKTINDVLKIYPKKVKGYILDVRGNLGGQLDTLMSLSESLFRKGSTVFLSEDKFGDLRRIKTKDESKRNLWRKDLPWAILIDENTASASEVLVHAIVDNKKDVTILGQPSYGKGKMQSNFNLSEDDLNISFTIGKMLSPKGNEMDQVTIKPDVLLTHGQLFPTFDKSKDKSINRAIEEIF